MSRHSKSAHNTPDAGASATRGFVMPEGRFGAPRPGRPGNRRDAPSAFAPRNQRRRRHARRAPHGPDVRRLRARLPGECPAAQEASGAQDLRHRDGLHSRRHRPCLLRRRHRVLRALLPAVHHHRHGHLRQDARRGPSDARRGAGRLHLQGGGPGSFPHAGRHGHGHGARQPIYRRRPSGRDEPLGVALRGVPAPRRHRRLSLHSGELEAGRHADRRRGGGQRPRHRSQERHRGL